MKNKKIIITGTHHTPAHQLINTLKKDSQTDWEIHYLGRKYNFQNRETLSIEYQTFPGLGVKFHPIKSGRFNRRSIPKTILSIKGFLQGFFQSYQLIKKIKPQIVVSFGGYLSVPVIIGSYLQKIPSITHEQTTAIGLSTRINSFFVNKIALSFENPGFSTKKTIVTGNLLRSEIFENHPGSFSKIQKQLRDKKKKLLYITGGNQGASLINRTILSILPDLLKKDFIIIHQTGHKDYPEIKKQTKKIPLVKNFYLPIPFISTKEIGWVLKNSDLIISRSGANISQEIATLHQKTIFIPLPGTQNNEQEKNALWTKKYAPVKTMKQSTVSPQSLLNQILKSSTRKITKKYPPLHFEKASGKLLKLIREISL